MKKVILRARSVRLSALIVGIGTCILESPASATYSIAIVDMQTGDTGAAIASCVPFEISFVYQPVPGKGAVIAQASYYERGRNEAAALLRGDGSPDNVIAAITDTRFDPDSSQRQYAVLDIRGTTAVYTGAKAYPFAGSHHGHSGRFSYAVQGNILTGESVLSAAEASVQIQARDLPDRLMLALEAGSRDGQGDARCSARGRAATSAFSPLQ